MPQRSGELPVWTWTLATMGGLVFVASLVFCGVRYAGRFGQPIDWTTTGAPALAILTNAALFTAFALHHSIFARTGAKAWLGRHVPPALERATYVWISSVLFLAVVGGWRLVPGTLWALGGWSSRVALALQAAGILFTLAAARRLDVLRLAGLRQVCDASRPSPDQLDTDGPYRLVRHPVYLGWFFMVWPTPLMTGTRVEFALLSSVYLLAAVPFEERDLTRLFGDAYRAYQRRVRWRILPFVY